MAVVLGGCAHKKHLTRSERAAIEAAERQRVADSIAAAQEAKRAMVQTMSISRMTLNIRMQGQQIVTPATVRWQRGTGVIAGVQPFAGIEMLRVEMNSEALTIIDKINMRYARMSTEEMSAMGLPASMDEVDKWIDDNILARRNEPRLIMEAERAGVSAQAVINTASIQTDANVNMRATNVNTYKHVTLEQLLTGF